MSIIRAIEIRHFRSVYRCKLTDLKSMNVFAGSNDSGKSNILRALNLFFNGETSFLQQFAFNQDYSKLALKEAREKKKGRQFISITIWIDVESIKGKAELKRFLKSQAESLWVKREWWKYEDTYREELPPFMSSASQGLKRSLSVLLTQIKFIYIPALKSANVFSYVLSIVGNEEGIFIDQAAKDNLNSQIAGSAHNLARDFQELTDIDTKVSLPITLDSFWSSLQVATNFAEEKGQEGLRGNPEDYMIALDARGEGIKSIFTPVILGWLATNNPKVYWIWGIDEPENSLEASRCISLFRKFIEYSKHSQIFASSHSPVFIFPNASIDVDNFQTLVTTQESGGDTRFREIDSQDSRLKDKLLKAFGVDYGTFLNTQQEYSVKLQEMQIESDQIKEKLQNLQRPVVFVEGELDLRYFQRAVELFYDGAFVADVRWIGDHDGTSGQARFTGKDALDKFKAFAKSNPEFIGMPVVLLYDVDTGVSPQEEGRVLSFSPTQRPNSRYATGSEHLLTLPDGFNSDAYFSEATRTQGDKTTTIRSLDKTRLCSHILEKYSTDEQEEILTEFKNELERVKRFVGDNTAD